MKWILLSLLLTGCASETRFQVAETTFHTLNSIDQAQSINAISHSNCYHESDPFTSKVLGEKPSAQSFAIYGLAISMAFHAINNADWMQDRPKLRFVFNAIAIGSKAWVINENHKIGMRVAGDVCDR